MYLDLYFWRTSMVDDSDLWRDDNVLSLSWNTMESFLSGVKTSSMKNMKHITVRDFKSFKKAFALLLASADTLSLVSVS